MRGKVTEYDSYGGTGLINVNADGVTYRFTVAVWKGVAAPSVGADVDLVLSNDQVERVTPTNEQEAVPGGGQINGSQSGQTFQVASLVERLTKPVLISYGAFLVATLFLPAVTGDGIGGNASMFQLASLLALFGGGGAGVVRVLLILAYFSIAVPLLWLDKRSWLALTVPLLAVLSGLYTAARAVSSDDPFSRGPSVFDFLGIGFYVAAAASVHLAAQGIKRFNA